MLFLPITKLRLALMVIVDSAATVFAIFGICTFFNLWFDWIIVSLAVVAIDIITAVVMYYRTRVY